MAVRAIPLAFAIFFGAIVAVRGVPALRHDWVWPASRFDALSLLTTSLSPWDPRGIGGPNLYVNDYLVSLVVASCVVVFGSQGGLFVFMVGIAGACSFGAAALARRMGAGPWGQVGVSAIGLFNPWVYTETIAGHSYMIFAYGALLAFSAECLRRSPRPVVASLLVVATLQQSQFFLAAVPLAAALAVRRQSLLPLATAAVVASPLIALVIAESSTFNAVPYSLAWISSQSVAPTSAFALTGYFAGYTQGIDHLAVPVMWAVVVVALIGFSAIARSQRAWAFALATVAAIIAAMGFRGPLEGFERFAITHVPAARIFRELFDVLGFAAVGYCAGVAAATRRRFGAFAAITIGCTLATSWVIWSPWRFWVPAADVPAAPIWAQNGTRFALFPPFQPLSRRADGAGSGLDPDARTHPGDVDPLNTSLPAYPVVSALAGFYQRGDSQPLAALGVSEIIDRRWLKSDDEVLASQRAIQNATAGADPPQSFVRNLEPAPLVSLDPTPSTCSVCTTIGADAVFFGDVAGMRDELTPPAWATYPRVVAIPPQIAAVKADSGWVDARLAFAADPDLGQPFGGAITTAHDVTLPVTGGLDALVFVRGELTSSGGAPMVHTTSRYTWVPIPRAVSSVRCNGLCVVAIEAARGIDYQPEGVATPAIAVAFHEITPWLLSADVPPGAPALLHYNVTFTPGWLALSGSTTLAHVRVDAVTNGWLLPARDSSGAVTIVEWPSATAAVLELFGFACTIALALSWLRSIARRDDEAARKRRPKPEHAFDDIR